jgi:iron only hydrogenase large subunit-like protein
MSILSGLIRNRLAKERRIDAADIYIANIGGCLAQKSEVARKQLAGLTDVSLTVRELVALIGFSGVNFHSLKDAEFDAPYHSGDAGFAISGGVLAAVLRQTDGKGQSLEKLVGSAIQKVLPVKIGGKDGKVVAIHGLADGMKFLDRLTKGDPALTDVRVVEILACPGGCVAGGGSVKPENKAAIEARVAAIRKLALAGSEDRMVDVPQDLLQTTFARTMPK